jgi:hypothetical protein
MFQVDYDCFARFWAEHRGFNVIEAATASSRGDLEKREALSKHHADLARAWVQLRNAVQARDLPCPFCGHQPIPTRRSCVELTLRCSGTALAPHEPIALPRDVWNRRAGNSRV